MFRWPGRFFKLRLTNGHSIAPFPQDNPFGIEVCLSCFNGGCLDSGRHHARTHVYKLGHTFSLNVKRKLKPSTKRVWLSQSFLSSFLIIFHRLKMKNHLRRWKNSPLPKNVKKTSTTTSPRWNVGHAIHKAEQKSQTPRRIPRSLQLLYIWIVFDKKNPNRSNPS